jgi:hypothetical protein
MKSGGSIHLGAAARVCLVHLCLMTFTEQKGYAPKTSQTDHCVNDPAEQRILSAEQPGDKIKLKNAYQSPVQAADNGENLCQSVHNFSSLLQYPGDRIPDFSTSIRK